MTVGERISLESGRAFLDVARDEAFLLTQSIIFPHLSATVSEAKGSSRRAHAAHAARLPVLPMMRRALVVQPQQVAAVIIAVGRAHNGVDVELRRFGIGEKD